jgi:hypothetical protein
LFRNGIKTPVSLAIVENDLFWTTMKSQRLSWTDKHNIGLIKRMNLNLPANSEVVDEIQLLALTPVEVTPEHPCQKQNGGCSHICISASATKSSCLCPAGLVFSDALNTTCTDAQNCGFK